MKITHEILSYRTDCYVYFWLRLGRIVGIVCRYNK
jgi:hypothetical protein